MTEKNNIARMKCPICGVTAYLRENKNGVLYSFCHNLHHFKLNKEDSRAAKNALSAGMTWNNGVIYIYPLEKQQNESEVKNDGNIKRTTDTRADYRGRTDGQHAATANARTITTGTTGTNGTTESDDTIGMF